MKSIKASTYFVHFKNKGYEELNALLIKKNYSSIFILVDENTLEHCYPSFIETLETKKRIEVIEIESGEIYKNYLKLKFENSINDKIYDIIVEDKNNSIYYKSNVFADDNYLNIELDLSNLDTPVDPLKLTFLTNNISYEMLIKNSNQKLVQNSVPHISLGLKMVIIAFLGGFILNFMPCVLPVLSLKMIQLVNYRTESIQVFRKKIIFNILGILVTFFLFSLLTYLIKATGNYVGWGIQFQSPYFLIFMILLTLLKS